MHKTSIAAGEILGPMRLLLLNYGAFLTEWAHFELVIELALKRELGLTYKQTHILCANLQHATKFDILKSLLNQKENTNREKIRALQNAKDNASRNHLIHALLVHRDKQTVLDFVKREAKGNLVFKSRRYTADSMYEHLRKFGDLVKEAEKLFGITTSHYREHYKAVQASLGESQHLQ
jgi:hypothetical protein